MTDKTDSKEREVAEQWLRDRYGAYRGHFAWRELEEAFLAGRASLAASAGSEPVAWQVWWGVGEMRPHWPPFKTQNDAADHASMIKSRTEVRPLYTHPSPPEGMVGGLQVYRCKIKSRKQIDREIPRELQGWWADVAAGQKLLLRQAVQSDLDRCNLGGKRSRNPADYMCETHTYGSLVSKVALEYMNPEENVFAAPPTSSADNRKGGVICLSTCYHAPTTSL